MGTLFEGILYLSAAAVWLVPFALLVRAMIRKAPAAFSYALWLIVFLRLASPVWLTTEFGILPEQGRLQRMAADWQGYAADAGPGRNKADAEPIQKPEAEPGQRAGAEPGQKAAAGTPAVADAPAAARPSVAEKPGEAVEPSVPEKVSVKEGVPLSELAAYLWLSGLVLMLGYTAARYSFFLRKAGAWRTGCVKTKRSGYRLVESAKVPGPFTAGILRPTVYLPAQLERTERKMILEHEKMHIRRRDYLVKAFAWLLVCTYWFHPFVWLAFGMLEKDMELSCDEAVIRKLGAGCKRAYALTLLHISEERPMAGCFPVAFGEKNAAARIRRVVELGRIKASAVLLAVGLLLVTALTACVNRSAPEETVSGAEKAGSVSGEAVIGTEEADGVSGETVSGQEEADNVSGETVSGQEEADDVLREAAQGREYPQDPYQELLRDYEPEEQLQQTRTFWSAPVADARISEPCGKRIHPVTKQEEWHTGIDFAAEAGTPVMAAADGTVLETGWNSDCGNYVILAHQSGELSYYANCSEILAEEGTRVERGEKIAKVGNTGASTGTHLHFAVSVSGGYEIPLLQEAVTETDSGETWLMKAIAKAVLQGNSSRYGQEEISCAGEGHVLLDMEKEQGGERRRIYALTSHREYRLVNGAMERLPSTGIRPTVILLQMREDGAHLPLEISWPLEGNQYEESVRRMFPKEQWEKVLSPSEEICGDLEAQEEAYATRFLANHPKEAEKSKEAAAIGIPVLLPANTGWISEREYRKVDENRMEVRYHDAILDADFTLQVVKNGELYLPDQYYESSLEQTWFGKTKQGKGIEVRLQYDAAEGNVLASWEYGAYRFAILGQPAKEQTDVSPVAKTALDIIENLE